MKQPHKYKDLTPEAQEELFSNFLIDSWSYSKVATFARNEKAFEMSYIYCQSWKRSASEVSGSAYHAALEYYFNCKKQNITEDLAALQTVAYNYIDDIGANNWKLQKTTPSIEACKIKAIESCNKLLNNFFTDLSVYESELKEVLAVELYCDEYLHVNGVPIPLPCHARIDEVILTTKDKVVIIDHKSKAAYTDEKEIQFSIGKQAITYTKCYEAKEGRKVDEVWFIENKPSENKDKSPQLKCNKVVMDLDTRRLYEAMLYEPLKRMLEAISSPDYVYLINENDSFVDKAEIYDFWAQTLIAEVTDFDNVPESKKELITKRLKKVRDASLSGITPNIIKKFRENAAEFIQYDLTNKNMTREQKIERVLRTLGIIVNVAHTFSGYSSDTFLIEVSAGTKLANVQRYKLDIASALNVASIRMMPDLYVYEGKSYLAVEAGKVRDKNLNFDPAALSGSRIPLGYDNYGKLVIWNVNNPSTPHVLICGSTGSGKSVCIISIIEYAKLYGFTDIIIFDPKFEFIKFKGGNITVHNDIEEIETIMELLVEEMNGLVKSGSIKKTLVVFDEFADAVANSAKGKKLGNSKSLEENLRLLLQKGRSSGYRIIAATQRASVKVITGDSKVNFPVQICFKVPKEVDSKVVIDEPGAESLSGKGDGLLKSPEYQGVVRFQAFYKA